MTVEPAGTSDLRGQMPVNDVLDNQVDVSVRGDDDGVLAQHRTGQIIHRHDAARNLITGHLRIAVLTQSMILHPL